jgi:hypothetical protein
MKKYYFGMNTHGLQRASIESEENVEKGWKWITVRTADAASQGVIGGIYVKPTNDGWKVAWEESVGYNPVPLKSVLAQGKAEPITLRLGCQMSDYYNGRFEDQRQLYYSISITDAHPVETAHAYVLKDSPEGNRLFNRLKDGRFLQVTLEVVPVLDDPFLRLLLVNRVVSDSWIIP